MYPRHEVDRVLALVEDGMSDSGISRVTGISRTTISGWRRYGPPGTRPRPTWACPRCHDAPLDQAAYSYLLGLYLGDGHIAQARRAYSLRITQDARYPHLINLASESIHRVRGGHGRVGLVAGPGVIVIQAYSKHWPCVFPQHVPGRKHHRKIELVPWQMEIVDAYPRQLVRGLIHSDGCRVMNRVWAGKYEYPRYFFTNNSADILRIFRDACDRIGVLHRNSKANTISIARRHDVAALDRFIGPKT